MVRKVFWYHTTAKLMWMLMQIMSVFYTYKISAINYFVRPEINVKCSIPVFF